MSTCYHYWTILIVLEQKTLATHSAPSPAFPFSLKCHLLSFQLPQGKKKGWFSFSCLFLFPLHLCCQMLSCSSTSTALAQAIYLASCGSLLFHFPHHSSRIALKHFLFISSRTIQDTDVDVSFPAKIFLTVKSFPASFILRWMHGLVRPKYAPGKQLIKSVFSPSIAPLQEFSAPQVHSFPLLTGIWAASSNRDYKCEDIFF